MSRRRFTRNEKIFYILSLVIIFSMIVGLIAVAITPAGF
jgi:cell division protein FtsL